MPRYEHVIFDVDGTLIDTEKAVIYSLQKMLKEDYNRELEASELYFVLGIPGAVALPQLGIKDISHANERWNFFMKDFYHTMSVFDGITDLLIALHKQRMLQGIVTSKTNVEFDEDFVQFGITKYFSHIICADDTEKHKPNPEPLLQYMKISNASPETSVYIGDTIYDYECARDAGIDFGLALWGCKQHNHIPAKYKFETPQDVLRVLNKLER
ncbi:HAD family hydrolase [Paenibacillus sp. GCM10027626]|uniref:HAD family hydrolase n=1 Tax=Paenibacillus sp. GCM10027626 TaxID=3273411 RepID=UPI0036382635